MSDNSFFLHVYSREEARDIDERDNGNVEAVTEADESTRLHGGVRVERFLPTN